ncbi:MAG: ureidoglycolate hydrolase [Lentisphaerae bacterium]|nr:ureidoglycolate hydrolase [Lentisphaerota bacterium]MCP4102867.1 ureidoglycolate hydrolase [Lentisphaerota bacterium]
MKKIKIQKLSIEKFHRYGSFANMLNATGDSIGEGPFIFFRDMLHQDLSRDSVCYSILRVQPREFKIEASEYHNFTAEMLMAMDQDIAIHVAPADSGEDIPVDRFEVFRVPKGTMVILRQGVWHHAPFSLNDKPANILIGLPERLYKNDLVAMKIPEGKQPAIEI